MAQVKKLLDSARQRASNILSSHEADLHLLASTLLDKETMSGTQARPSCLLIKFATCAGVPLVVNLNAPGCSCKQACACPENSEELQSLPCMSVAPAFMLAWAPLACLQL